jgi:hypothetical protein
MSGTGMGWWMHTPPSAISRLFSFFSQISYAPIHLRSPMPECGQRGSALIEMRMGDIVIRKWTTKFCESLFVKEHYHISKGSFKGEP